MGSNSKGLVVSVIFESVCFRGDDGQASEKGWRRSICDGSGGDFFDVAGDFFVVALNGWPVVMGCS